MARRSLIIFYTMALVLFVGLALLLAGASVFLFVKHRGEPWVDLLLIPVWLLLARSTRNLLRREIARGTASK